MNEFSTNMNSKTTARINEHDWLTAWLKSQNLLYCDLPTGSQSIRKLNKFLCRIRETISLLWKRNKKTRETFLHILACRLVLVTITTATKKNTKKRWLYFGGKNLLNFLGCRESKGGYYNLLRKKYFVNSETLKRKLKKYIRLSQTNYIERCAVGNVMRALFIFCATKVITFWKQIFIFIHYTLLMKFQRLYSSPCLHKTYWGNN